MAFPILQTADTTNGTVTTNASTWTLTYPTNVAAGDLLLAFIAHDGGTYTGAQPIPNEIPGTVRPAFPSGWTVRAEGDTQLITNGTVIVTLAMAYKISDGTETGNFSITINNSDTEQGGWRVFRITNWRGSSSGITQIFAGSSGTTSSTPNPPSLTPSWGADDTLWVAAMAADTSRTISVYPTSYGTTSADVSGGNAGATLGVAFRSLNAASEDPGTFTISASDDWSACTVAIQGPPPSIPWIVGIPIR